jgi:hypothetical protein
MSVQPGKSQGNKIVLAKIPREEFTRFQLYSGQNGETTNATLRRLILTEIDKPRARRIAGKSVFEYNKQKDNFTWKVICDDDSAFEIDSNLPASSLEQLLGSIKKATDERNLFIRKNKSGSVSFPNKLLRGRL